MTIEILLTWALRLAGTGFALLVLANFLAARELRYAENTARMETIPRQIFYVHSAYIVALVSAMAVACFVFTAEFIEGGASTARGLVLFMAVFWLSRLVIQLTYYDKAARRERPFLNALFAAGFGYFAALFGALTLRHFGFW